RPSDAQLDALYAFAVAYFDLLAATFPEVRSAFRSKRPSAVVRKHRGSFGGHILFRPLGQKVFAEVTASLLRNYSLEDAVSWLAELPTELTEEPYLGLVWNPSERTMLVKN